MTKDEVLRLAWDALEDIGDEWGFTSQRTVPKRKEAITAIKEALAQPEQEPCCYGGIAHDCHAGEGCRIVNRMKATSPQRTWVGLTDEDFQPMVQKAMVYYGYKPEHSTLTSGAGFYALVRDIEAKLRSKNESKN